MSAAIKKSVRLAGSTIDTIESVSKSDNVNWSRSINIIASRYALFAEHGLPTLTDNEKMIIMMCFGEREINNSDIEHEIGFLHLQIAQGVEMPETNLLFVEDNKPLSGDDLVNAKRLFCKRAKLWNKTERLAILHHVDSTWVNAKTPVVHITNNDE